MRNALFVCLFITSVTVCGAAERIGNLRPGFPRPVTPKNNPPSAAKVELGRHLFYDQRMSVNGKLSCAGCHRQELAFTDGKSRSEGATGELHPRGAMSLVNVAYARHLTWADPKRQDLEEQALVPLLGREPLELGMSGHEPRFLSQIAQDTTYQRLFAAAFPGEHDPYSIANAMKAIASFERSIVSTNSPYDRYRYEGDQDAISPAAKRGELLFFSSERAGCFQCHGGWNFSGSIRFEGQAQTEDPRQSGFHNTGLYNAPGPHSYPPPNTGLFVHTRRPEDVGRFLAPTLRNIAVTAPYMHDGSIATLEEVVEHYAHGGRAEENPNKSPILTGFKLSGTDKSDLVEFLKSLTDQDVLTNPKWSDPWHRD
jgi:cytochrome c peroxidase